MSWNFFFNDYKNIPQALNAVPSREYSRPMKLTKLRSKELKWFPKAQIFHLMEELRRELILPVQCFSMTRCCYVLDENHCVTKLEKRFPLRAPRSRPSLEAPRTPLLRGSSRGLPWAAALRAAAPGGRRPRCPAPSGEARAAHVGSWEARPALTPGHPSGRTLEFFPGLRGCGAR